jgi:hypothetical protein
MFNLDALKRNSRRAAAFGMLALAATAFSGAATAAPLPLFPFILTPPAAPPPVQAAPSEDEDTVAELPTRLKRQVVSYTTREAPGTVIIDTPTPISIMCSAAVGRSATASVSAATASPGRAYSR